MSSIAAIGALEHPVLTAEATRIPPLTTAARPLAPITAPAPQPSEPEATQAQEQEAAASARVQSPALSHVEAMQQLVQANSAQAIFVQNAIQSTEALMEANATASPRAQEAAAAAEANAEKQAQVSAAMRAQSSEQAAEQSAQVHRAQALAGIGSLNLRMAENAAQEASAQAQALAQATLEKAQQNSKLLAAIGNNNAFSQELGAIAPVESVGTGTDAIPTSPLQGTIMSGLPLTAPAPLLGLPPSSGLNTTKLSGITTATGTTNTAAPAATGTAKSANGTALFDSRGNLQLQSLPDLTLLGQRQAQSVQQALARNQSLTLSVTGQIQPSLVLQLGLGIKLFELLMATHRRLGSLSILQDASSANSLEVQAIESDPTIGALQQSNQLLCIAYLDYIFALIASIRRNLAQKRSTKATSNGQSSEDGAPEGTAEGSDELSELSAELDYIKRARQNTTNQDFHASMLIPRN